MKKFALAAVAAAAALTGGVASAYTVGTFSNGFVVPNVIDEGNGKTTAIGIINRTNSVVPVFWVFHDENSGHVTDGCFPLTANQYKGLGWNQENEGGETDLRGANVVGKRGYMVFAAGTSTGTTTAATACKAPGAAVISSTALLSANAFQLDPANSDVAVTPVIDGPLGIDPTADLTSLDAASLTRVGGAATVTSDLRIAARYANHVPTSSTSRVTVWSTGNHKGTHTVNVYDAKQNRRSTNFELKNAELDFYDPAEMTGLPTSHTDGFILWSPGVLPANAPTATSGANVPLANTSGSVFVYSTISIGSYGAVQTLLGAHHNGALNP
ncbi:MAG TPA: hypothetical protein GXX41_14015 [Thermoanaerobacterium sp.]|nr:hypothetical protein [Thermoanaerobacterium sp.]